VLEVLRGDYGSCSIFQEHPIDVKDEHGSTHHLFLDFYVREMGMAIECQGEQHYKPNSHFFSGKASFRKMQGNDAMKKQWCEDNDIMLIEVIFSEEVTPALIRGKIKDELKIRSKKK
jgi:hypothetical protein